LTFKLHLIGGGSLASAWALYNQIQHQLDLACSQEVTLYRRIRKETATEFMIINGTLRMIDPINQSFCEADLTVELTVVITSISGRRVDPYVINLAIPQIAANLARVTTPDPLFIDVIPVDGINNTLRVTPNVLQITKSIPAITGISGAPALDIALFFPAVLVQIGDLTEVMLTHSYVGYNTVGGSTENATDVRVYMKKITLSQPGLLSSIGAHVNQTTDHQFGIGVAVISDNAGAPDKLLAYNSLIRDSMLLETSGTPTYAAGWVQVPIGLYLAAGDYWICTQFDVLTGTLQIYYDAGSDRIYTPTGPFFSHAGRYADTDSTRKYSIRADFFSLAALDYIHLQDQKTQNTAGGTFTSGADRTRDLNTEVTDSGNHCSLAGNQFTLDAGTYRILATAPGYKVDRHRAWLYNTSDAAVTILGTSEFSSSGDAVHNRSVISGRFVIASSKTFEIRHRCQTTFASQGFGVESNFTGAEVYTDVELWKEA
jgi:hypothetical protein